jgi:myo-inositol 2-dehydrogenase/D-chiro-inositol 1-dehydrogenase
MTLSIGVVGTGSIGRDHVQRLTELVPGVRVGAVFDVDAGRAGQVAAEAGARVHADATTLIDDPAVDAVLIASPGDTHAELVLACIAADKPVLCEKPLATSSGAAAKVVAAEAGHGRRLIQVGFMRRYDAGYQQAKATLDGGQVGEALLLHCSHRNPTVPDSFTSDMSLTDSVVHEIDAARWLLGQEITATTVVATRRTPYAAHHLRDPQLVLLETDAGVVVDVEIFVNCQYGYDVQCEVVGSLGTVSVETPTTGTVTVAGTRAYPVSPNWRVRFGAAYLEELRAWTDGLREGRVAGPSAWDGYVAAEVAGSCVESLSTGARTTVSVGDRPPFYQ